MTTLLALGASKAIVDDAGIQAFLAAGEADQCELVMSKAGGVTADNAAFIAAITAPPSGTRSQFITRLSRQTPCQL